MPRTCEKTQEKTYQKVKKKNLIKTERNEMRCGS
jgi:hypothetical protein